MSTSGKTDDAKKAAVEEAAPFSTPSPGNPVMSFLQSPVPTKPAQSLSVDIAKGNLNPVETRTRTQVQNKNGASESNVVKEYSVKPYTSSTQSTSAIPSTSSSVKKLVVKQDPNLKSCLTQTPSFSTPPNNNSNNNESNNNTNSNININNENNNNNNNGQAGVGQNRPALTHPESEHTQHPQFLSTDNISPNNHGLGIAGKNPQTEEFAVVTPSHYTPMVPNQGAKITSPPLQASSNSTNSITNTTTTTAATTTSSSSATTTTTNAPTSATSPIIGVRTQSPLLDTHEQHPVFQPSMSRMNSLRYKVDDKKYIETARHSNNNSEENLSSNLDTALEEEKSKLHLLIGITGCISIHKNVFLIIEKLFELYTHDNLEIQVILTKSAEYILSEKLHKFDEMGVRVWFSDDGWKYFLTSPFQKYYTQAVTTGNLPAFKKQFHSQNQILQQYSLVYDLQRWTDVLLLAPLSANTMAKLITGLSDNLLTDLLRIWPAPQVHYTDQNTAKQAPVKPHPHPHPLGEVKKDTTVISNNLAAPKPIISALALTNSMYSHPITKRQLVQLQETYPNMSILKPVEKCVDMDGNIAMGGMRSWREVVDFVCKKLGPPPEDEDEDEDEEEGDDDREEANDIDAILEENDDDDDDDDDEEEEEEEDTSETV